MNEYFGESAKKYGQPRDKFFTLFPALESAIPSAQAGQTAIDLGCGTGILCDLLTQKGYSYTGVDLSEDMLAQARIHNPNAQFIHGDVTKSLPNVNQKFDVVTTNMLFPSIGNKAELEGIFALASSLLTDTGRLIVGTGHPCFDGYMQKHFLQREDIETNFTGYFNSGAKYTVHRALDHGSFTFNDHHWTLRDYLEGIEKAGLQLSSIDECDVVGEPPKEVVEKYAKKGSPSYIVFIITKK